MIFDVNLEQLGWNDSFAAQFKTFAADDYIPGRIAREDRGRYSVWTADGEVSGEITGAFRHEHISPAEFPAVGDWVAVEPIPGESKGRIHAVLPRRTVFMRTAAGGTSDAQVAAANVDIMFLVSGLDHDFNVRRIERYLTLAYESGARPVILLNKMDLADDLDSNIAEVEQVAFGVPVHAMSAIDRAGVDVVRRYLAPGVTGAFVGSSGVGKSTLINALAVESLMATSAVREDDSRGRHTTTYRQLFLLPQGGLLIDTPGMRELQMAGSGEGLSNAFADVEALASQCRFRDCSHNSEPGCAIRASIEDGSLDASRYAAYTKLQKEIAYNERRYSENRVAEERKRGREFGKMLKEVLKHKRHKL